MSGKRGLWSLGAVVIVTAAMSASARIQNPSARIVESAIGQTGSQPPIVLQKPTEEIEVTEPIAFKLVEDVEGDTHTTWFLLSPNEGETSAKAEFEFPATEPPTFFIERGFVYIAHEKVEGEAGGARTGSVTRPRARTTRVVSAGRSGTTFLVQVRTDGTERVIGFDCPVDVSSIECVNNPQVVQNEYFVSVTTQGCLSAPSEVKDSTAMELLRDAAKELAGDFSVPLPAPCEEEE